MILTERRPTFVGRLFFLWLSKRLPRRLKHADLALFPRCCVVQLSCRPTVPSDPEGIEAIMKARGQDESKTSGSLRASES